MSNKALTYYRYEANENLLSSVVIALYNEYKKPSNDFDKFSNDLFTNNIFSHSIPIIDVLFFLNTLNEKNMPSVLRKSFNNPSDLINSKIDLVKLFNDCIEANLHTLPSVESYSIKQVASLLNVNTQTITTLIKNGEINSFLVGSRYRILARDVNYFIQKSKKRNSGIMRKNPENINQNVPQNTSQKSPVNQNESKTVNYSKTSQKPQNMPQNQPQKKKQIPQNNEQKPHFKEKKPFVQQPQKQQQSPSTLPYHTLPSNNNGKLEEIMPKQNTVKKVEIIEDNKEKVNEKDNNSLDFTLPEVVFGKEKVENKTDNNSEVIVENIEKQNNDDIFGEVKTKEELAFSSQNTNIPDITLGNETEKEVIKEETKEEIKEEEVIIPQINKNKDFILINEDNKEENNKSSLIDVSNINETQLEKEGIPTTIPYPTLKNIGEIQKSDIINSDNQNDNPINEEDTSKNKILKINYLNK